MCSKKELGGLRVQRVREFNMTLLVKWCSCLLVDKGGLCYKVLTTKYVVEYGQIRGVVSKAFVWWKDLCSVWEGVREFQGGWFK